MRRARIIKATTGLDRSKQDLAKTANRITSDVRHFNVREGITRKDDTLPARFFDEPLKGSGARITRDELDTMVSDYYRLRGWSEEGVPLVKGGEDL